jgi:diaminopimelate epimerase
MIMKIEFHKYQGTGNDFVMIDNRDGKLDRKDKTLAQKLCHRKFGVGADGLILIENHQEYDFEMIYFNPDGSQSMCGNGSRCAVLFAYTLGIIGESTVFLSTDGVHSATIEKDQVDLSMHDVTNNRISNKGEAFQINTGSPHYVTFEADVQAVNVKTEGAAIRYNDVYKKEGINVNFVEELASGEIKVRTYERGVEDETLSCGTGVTACAIAHVMKSGTSPVTIHTEGGTLEVSFQWDGSEAKNVHLKGPALKVFEGLFNL